jgi:hypothetical protein
MIILFVLETPITYLDMKYKIYKEWLSSFFKNKRRQDVKNKKVNAGVIEHVFIIMPLEIFKEPWFCKVPKEDQETYFNMLKRVNGLNGEYQRKEISREEL